MDDLISVIVPIYNTENYIKKTLQSIVKQTYRNFEIILIDDASTDKTLEIVTRFANKYSNIKLVRQEINKGVSAARNTGLKLAKGTYVTFVDSDDILTSHALESLHRTAMENDADLVLGIYKNLSSEGTRLGSIYKWHKSLTNAGRVFPFTNQEIFSHIYIFGKLYRKDLIEDVKFPEGISYAEDQPFTMYTYLHAKKIYIAPTVVYYYREREKGESVTQLAIKEPLKHIKSVIDSFEIGRNYFDIISTINEKYSLLLYVNRVIQGSVRYIFEGALILNNQIILQNIIIMLKNWIENLDGYLVAGTDSFQNVFFDNGQSYMKYLDVENQKHYIELLRVIKDKKFEGNYEYTSQINEKNLIIDFFVKSIDEILIINDIVFDKNYYVCYPTVTHFSLLHGKATVQFNLIKGNFNWLYEISMFKKNGNWIVNKPKIINEEQKKEIKVNRKRAKVLLTYRDFSGCNTFALYKSIPSFISENFDVEFVPGNNMSGEFVKKVMDSDIIVTTNMEYGFSKFGIDPNKIVVDLWHGFPLKNMFYEDVNYNDKSSISSYWKQFDHLLSYSELYSEVVNKCIKVNPNNYFISGAPRNDLLFSSNSREKIFRFLKKEDNGQKVLVYMPTFRLSDQRKNFDDFKNIFGFENFDMSRFISFLEENQLELIIKSHPIFGRNFENIPCGNSCITFITSIDLMNNGTDFYEILGASDILITDYSSVYFDYLLLDKPIIFTPTDLERYEVERGFILESYEKWTPGPKVVNQLDFQDEIINYEKNSIKYKDHRSKIKNLVHYYQDSNSTDRVWKFINSLWCNRS